MTDQFMPGMAGSELAEEIVKLKPGCPVILCTGLLQAISEDTINITSIHSTLTKPFNMSELAQAIRNALDD